MNVQNKFENFLFAGKIGADFYSPDPQGALEYLNNL